jgi:hypothetical protein
MVGRGSMNVKKRQPVFNRFPQVFYRSASLEGLHRILQPTVKVGTTTILAGRP